MQEESKEKDTKRNAICDPLNPSLSKRIRIRRWTSFLRTRMPNVHTYARRNRASAIPGAGLTSLIKAAGISVAMSANNGYGHGRAAENCGPKNTATAKSKHAAIRALILFRSGFFPVAQNS